MDEFLKQLEKALVEIGFVVESKPQRLEVDKIVLRAEYIDNDAQGRERIRFMRSIFTIRTNGDIPNIDKAVGLALRRIVEIKQNRARWKPTPTSRGKDATIKESPGGYELTIKFTDQLSANAALDRLMEDGIVLPAE